MATELVRFRFLLSCFCSAFRFLGSRFTHGVAAQIDAVSVAHEAVEDAVSEDRSQKAANIALNDDVNQLCRRLCHAVRAQLRQISALGDQTRVPPCGLILKASA